MSVRARILIGAAINAVCSNRSEDVDISPVIGGVAASVAESPAQSGSPAAAVAEIQDRLPTAGEVELIVDGDSIAIPVPESAETDTDSSRLPFVADTVGIRLEWRDDGTDETDRTEP